MTDEAVRPRAAADVLAAGIACGLVGCVLAAFALLHIAALAAAVFVVQAVLVLAWLAALDARGARGDFLIGVATAGIVDGLVGTASSADIGRGAGVVGAGVVVALLHQLARRNRRDVTLSVAGALSSMTFALAAASYVALAVETGGDRADVAALLGAGVALAVGRLVDLVLARPAAAPGSRRGIVGLVVGIAAAGFAGWAAGRDGLSADAGIRIAIVAAVIASVADLAVDAVLTAAPPADDRARSAIPPLGILLPVVLAGPAAYVAARILLG